MTTQPIRNNSGALLPDKILEQVVEFNGLFRKIFGETHDDIVYDTEAEFCRRMLREVWLFRDTDQIFPKILDEKRYFGTLETVFRFFKPTE